MTRTSRFAGLLAGLAIVATVVPVAAQSPAAPPVAFTLWTKDGTPDGGFQFVSKLATDYMTAHPGVTITVVNKDVEKLRQDFLTTSLAHAEPEMLWTAGDHVGPFTASVTPLIQPVDSLFDTSQFLPAALGAVQLNGQTWGVPVSFGNNLMLYTNKDLIPDCPADSDAWIAAAKAQTGGGNYGMVFPQTESFWMLPFLGAYGGTVFGADGVTATLNTPAMVSALTFLKNLKFTDPTMPADVDPATSDGMFKNGAPGAAPAAVASLAPSATPPPTGTAASVINGDWTAGAYSKLYGDKLNVCPIPKITGADWPRPFVAGEYLMYSADLAKDAAKQAAVMDFTNYIIGNAQQLDMVKTLKRLPATNTAFNDPLVTGDPLLAKVAAAAAIGIGTPGNLNMRCVWDAVTAGTKALFKSADSDPAAVAAQMQQDYDQNPACQA